MGFLVRWLAIAAQVAGIIAIYAVCQGAVSALNLHIPPGLLGMGIMLLLLRTGVMRLEWVDKGAGWLLGTMVLFFVPSAVGIMDYGRLLADSGIKLAIAVGVGTLSVMAVSGLTSKWVGGLVGTTGKCRGERGVGDIAADRASV